MTVYSETLVWSPPAELAALAPYQLLLVVPWIGFLWTILTRPMLASST